VVNTRLTKRDANLLRWIARLRYLSTSLVSEFFFDGNVRIARRRLRLLCDAGFLSWFLRPAFSRGSLEHVFYLNKKRKEEIISILGSSLSFYRPPQNPLLTNHDLGICRFILCLQRCCDSSEYSFEFFMGNEGQSKDVMPFVGKNKKSFVPDCTLKLTGKKGSSLLFLEHDSGSESIVAVSREKNDVQKKLNSYLGYLKYRGYERLSRKLGYQFKGFRLLIVTTPSRIKKIGELCDELDCAFAWITSFDKINLLFNKVWFVPCSEAKELRALVKS